jgi:hypothetical protein
MKRIGRWTGWLVLLMIFCALCACAQNVSLPKAVINVVTAFPHGRASIPETCQSQADLLWQTIQRYPHPENWRWILLCDEPAWQRVLTHVDRASEDTVYALTSLDARTTCFRGSTLLRPDRVEAQPDHVVAHELAHIALHTPDEDRVERLARQWLDSCGRREDPMCRVSAGKGVPNL